MDLATIEALKRLKAHYFFCLDTKDWAGFRAVFADDAVIDVTSHLPDGPERDALIVRGADAIVASVSGFLAGITTVHHGHTPILDLLGADAARGIWAMEDNLFLPDGSRLTGYGHYHEDYRRVGGEWRIAFLKLTRLKLFSRREPLTPPGGLLSGA